ncbi:MAG: selenide, water dikinase SelD [Planctomycetes bacterium]|nr:selenide, water dikinase SelD [Planctomycetota bacterium]
MEFTLPRTDIVLLGVGHTNAHILRMWRMGALPGASLTCVSNFPIATYSGMLPGVLAGQYEPEQFEIDLVRLCAAARARLVLDSVVGLDRVNRMIQFASRPALAFDLLSIGIGSTPSDAGLAYRGEALLPIKPMQTFLERLRARCTHVMRSGAQKLRWVVVGAGAGGCEVAMCLPAACQRWFPGLPIEGTIVTAADRIGNGLAAGTVARIERLFQSRSITVRTKLRVLEVGDDACRLHNGEQLPADLVIWATDARPPDLLERLGLSRDPRGFLRVRRTLQSVDDDHIFVVGDSASIDGESIPKAGVYAVREGPILWRNLLHAVTSTPMEEYVPQRDFLRLLNTGDWAGIGEYRGWSFAGEWVWRHKDRIDSRFMRMYQDYQPAEMNGSSAPADSAPTMRCAGCGGKVAGSVLGRVLNRLEVPSHPQVELGLERPDDAAIIRSVDPTSIAVTVDFFAAPLDDPYLLGRIATQHAASDLFAMGATPIAALAMATIPTGPAVKQEELLYQMLAGSLRELRRMGATLVGGHTIEGPALTLGFTMLGSVGQGRTKGQLKEGDCLLLTKPLGSGILLAAHQRAACRAAWMSGLVDAMLSSNQGPATLTGEFAVSGLTDVTGFGLAGHLLEMLRASGLAAEITLSSLPLLHGVASCVGDGIQSTLAPANRAAEEEIRASEADRRRPEYVALFDPQTCGGLLLGVTPDRVDAFIERCAHEFATTVARIGTVRRLDQQVGCRVSIRS